MRRFAIALLLTLTLLIGCHQFSPVSPPLIANWEGTPSAALTVKTVKIADPFIGWEAEKPTKTNFPPPKINSFTPANATESAILSNGQWIEVEDKRADTLFLEYSVQVPVADRYFFYGRKFWQHGPFRWRWDDQPWQQVNRHTYLMDGVAIRKRVSANWVGLGKVTLAKGTHTLRIELLEQEGAAAFDCFVLTPTPLQPRGKLKPNQRFVAQVKDGFIFDPEQDPFTTSPIDLRSLNENIAGDNGRIQVRGEAFVHQKTGRPVRFWAVNMDMEAIQMDRTLAKSTARFLAKKGVNMVRLHGALWSEDLKTIAPKDLDKLFGFIAAMKQEGIYINLSIYFPVWLTLDKTSQFAGYTGQNPFALLFFNPEFQSIYYGWWRSLLTTPNPYTGKPLRDDPAIAMVELINEDSYFFWTFKPYDSIPAAQMEPLEQQFADWLIPKYGSVSQAHQAWAKTASPWNRSIPGDTPDNQRAGVLPIQDLVAQRESLRAKDTVAFLANSQQQFFQNSITLIRQELGYPGLIYASNWVTASAQFLGPVDKLTNTVGDFMDRHGYFSSFHDGEDIYSVSQGDVYEDRSALLFTDLTQKQPYDFDLPIMDLRYNGKPSTITELNWTTPNRFRADFPILAATYGLLQGTDGVFFFATTKPTWTASFGKFPIASPVIMGQFPAMALIYRKGLIAAGDSVVDVSLNIQDVLNLKGAPITAPQNLDDLRASDVPTGQSLQSDSAKSIDPLAFLVGKVNLNFTDQAGSARQVDLTQYRDRDTKTVRSITNQLLWNYNKGFVTFDAAKAQGITGFLRKAGAQTLQTVRIQSDLDYGSVVLVSLDDEPLTRSRRMLLQVMSEEQTLGWKTTGSRRKTIQSVGNPLLTVRNLSGTVALRRPDAASLKVTALDFNGYPTGKAGNANPIKLMPDKFYYLIEK